MLTTVMGRIKVRYRKVTAPHTPILGIAIGLLTILLGTNSAAAQPSAGEIIYGSVYGGMHIFAVNADGSNKTCLTESISGTINTTPAVSYDGKKIAFRSIIDGNYELCMINADGSMFRRLSRSIEEEDTPALNSDGSKIVFTRRRNFQNQGIFIMNTDGTNLKLLKTGGYNPVFSPDGRRIAYTIHSLDRDAIYTMNLDGSNQTLLLERKGIYDSIAFSHDGRHIALAIDENGSSDIYIMNVSGSSPIRLTNTRTNEYSPSFSPDGRQIAFNAGPNHNISTTNICTMNVDGSNLKRITNDNSSSDPQWSVGITPAHAISIANAGVTEGEAALTMMGFTVRLSRAYSHPVSVDYETKDITATGTTDDSEADYSASRGSITFAPGQISQILYVKVNGDTHIESSETFKVVLSNARGAEIETAEAIGTIFNDDPSMRATGKIVFVSERDGNSEIYIMNANGSNQTRLTYSHRADSFPSLSKDGSKIVFSSSRDGGSAEIYIMNADGSNQRRLTNNQSVDESPSFSPDGTKIVFNSTDYQSQSQEIYLMNTDGSDFTRLTKSEFPDRPNWNRSPQFSPDGRKIIYTSLARTERGPGSLEVTLMNTDGTNQTNVITHSANDMYPSFRPDGRKIVFSSLRDGENRLYNINPNGTGTTLLSNTASYGYIPYDLHPSYSPDGKEIAFTFERDDTSQVYVMNENGDNRTALTAEGQNGQPSWSIGSVPVPQPRVLFNEIGVIEGHNGSKIMTFTANLSQPSSERVVVNYATANDTALAGSDYIPTKGTLVFQPGQTRLIIPVTIKGDTLPEGNETFFVQATSVRGAVAANRGVGIVLNDDEATLSIALSTPRLREGAAGSPGTSGFIRISRNTQINRDTPELAVDLVANPANQTSQPTRVTIPARTASVTVPISAVDDTIVDGTRNVTLTALAPGHKRASATIAVLDNDVSTTTRLVSNNSLSTAQAGGDVVCLTFTGAPDADSLDVADFAVMSNGQILGIESVSYNNGSVMLALLAGSTAPGDRLTVHWQSLRGADGKAIANGGAKLTVR